MPLAAPVALALLVAREKQMPRLTAEQRNRAVVMAQYIDCSPHEWPTERDIPVLCHALLDALNEIGTLREAAAVALGRKGGKAKVSKGPLAGKSPEERAKWAAEMVARRKAKQEQK